MRENDKQLGEVKKMALFVSETTYGELKFMLHATREEAVEHLLNEIGPDYANKFWASKDGKNIERSSHFLDFGICVYENIAEAISGQLSSDHDVLSISLRRIADAIDAWEATV